MPGARRNTLEPWISDSVEYYQHQADGIRQLMNMRSFLLADDMGLGKSLQAMTVFAVDVKRGWSEKALVVCPTTLKENWAEELEKFTRFPFVILEGDPHKRLMQIMKYLGMTGPRFLITNYEQIQGHISELNAAKFDTIIYDEAHYIKNFKSNRTKACHQLQGRRNFLLTGTPMLNHVNDLWSLLHKIAPNSFPDYWRFVNEFCVFGGFNEKQIIGVKNEKRLKDLLQDVMLRRLKSEVLDLPDVQIIERRVDLAPEARKLYDEVIDNMRLPIVGQAQDSEIENALTKFLRLKQICGTTLQFTGTDVSNKLTLAIEDDLQILEEGHKIVVFTQFRDVQAAYMHRMANDTAAKVSGISNTGSPWPVFFLNGDVPKGDRTAVVRAWSDWNGPAVIICMLQMSGLGLNMTAARHGSFLDELFVPGLNQQAIDRLNRIGADETQPIQIRKYLTRNTIENRVQQILKVKSKLFGEIVESDPNWKRKLFQALMEEGALK